MVYRPSAYRQLLLLLACLLLLGAALPAQVEPAAAAQPVVHAVLFFSPTCGHCHIVMTEDLPPLKEKYGDQLTIIEVDATQEEGTALYRSALIQYKVPRERYGVPALFVGDTLLVGSQEIPEQLPGMIETGLKSGGIELPEIPGLEDYLKIHNPEELEPERPLFVRKFLEDPLANSIAVVVLLGMIASVVAVGVTFLRSTEEVAPSTLPEWVVPVLCLIGLGIAGYLSFIEVTSSQPFCGPVGDCGKVQSSSFAKLFGVLHVGVLGVIGYLAILSAWLVKRFGTPAIRGYVVLAMWGMALIGTLFAIYLTFLEPFVIGATCAWCIGNSIVITLLTLVTTKPALQASARMIEDEE
jgi:uncharacterized membrane protein